MQSLRRSKRIAAAEKKRKLFENSKNSDTSDIDRSSNDSAISQLSDDLESMTISTRVGRTFTRVCL